MFTVHESPRSTVLWALAIGTSLAVPAFAEDQITASPNSPVDTHQNIQSETNRQSTTDMPIPSSMLVLGHNLIGKTVQTNDGTRIGIARDAIFNTGRRHVAVVIVQTDNEGQAGDQTAADHEAPMFIAIPWSQIDTSNTTTASNSTSAAAEMRDLIKSGPAISDRASQNDIAAVRLKLEKADLRKAESFSSAKWPSLNNHIWVDRVYQNYGDIPIAMSDTVDRDATAGAAKVEPAGADVKTKARGATVESKPALRTGIKTDSQARTGTSSQDELSNKSRLVRLGDLLDSTIQQTNGDALGSLDDVVIDYRQGQVIYAVIAHRSWLGLAKRETAVPFSALTFSSDPDDTRTVRINANNDQLDRLAIDNKNNHNYGETAWAERIHSEFKQQPYWQVAGYVSPSDQNSNAMLNSTSHTSYKGVVTSVDRTSAEGLIGPQTRVTIRTINGLTGTAYLGSDADLQRQELSIKEGTQIEIFGKVEKIGYSQALRASRVTLDGQSYDLQVTGTPDSPPATQ